MYLLANIGKDSPLGFRSSLETLEEPVLISCLYPHLAVVIDLNAKKIAALAQ